MIRSISDHFVLSPTRARRRPVRGHFVRLATDSHYQQPLRTFADHFVLSTTYCQNRRGDSVFHRLLRTFGDHFVPLPTNLRTFADFTSYVCRPNFVHLATRVIFYVTGIKGIRVISTPVTYLTKNLTFLTSRDF